MLLAVPLGTSRGRSRSTPGDFLSTYTGRHDAGLDVLSHEVRLAGDRLIISGRMAGPIAPTQGPREGDRHNLLRRLSNDHRRDGARPVPKGFEQCR
jgi:hypothetical protein